MRLQTIGNCIKVQDMSSTIYARVSPEMKEATEDYAKGHGMSLASAVSDLLSRGLEAAGNESSIESSNSALTSSSWS